MIKLLKNLKLKDYLYILLLIIFIVGQVWLDLTLPDYTKELTLAISTETATMDIILTNGGMMILCAVGSMLFAMASVFCCSQIAASFAKNIRTKLFDQVMNFSNLEMNEFSTPSLITRTTNDVVQIQNFMAMGLQMIIKAPIMAIWAICKISTTRIEWTLAAIISVAIIITVVVILVALCLPKFRLIQKLTDKLNDTTRENITGVRVVRAYNSMDYQENKFKKANDEITKTNLFTSRAMGLLNPVMTICMNGLTLSIYLIGAILINQVNMTNITSGMIERGELFANMSIFTQYAMQVIMAFMMLIMIFIILPRTMVSAKRINEVLDKKISIKDGTLANGNDTGLIEFKNVSFSYQGDDYYALSDLNFSINKGETVAFIGRTGSGKSTIINLLNRFYDVTKGEIIIDGENIKNYKEEALRNKIATVAQKAVLFQGDVKENILYGCNDTKDDDPKINKAIQIAHADFIYNLENGIHHHVAQGGSNFSGGQKQRISIARAIYKDSSIIIFDDSFSALDYKTDYLVRKSIKEELKDRTIIIVAQRIGTIKNADKIIVLDDGKISGIGTHEELLNNNEIYKEIALSQLSKEEL